MSKQLHHPMGKFTSNPREVMSSTTSAINYSPILSLPFYAKDTETHKGLVITTVSIFQIRNLQDCSQVYI